MPAGPGGPSRRKPRLNPPPPRRGSRRIGRLLCTSLKNPLPLQQAPRGFARLSALLEPAHHFVDVDLHFYRVGHRIVVPEVLDEPAISRRPRVRNHQAVKGVLLGPHPPQPYLDQPEPPCPNSRLAPALPPRFPSPNCLASFCIASRALRTLLTSA